MILYFSKVSGYAYRLYAFEWRLLSQDMSHHIFYYQLISYSKCGRRYQEEWR